MMKMKAADADSFAPWTFFLKPVLTEKHEFIKQLACWQKF